MSMAFGSQGGGFLDIKKDGFSFLPLMAAMCIFCVWKVLAFLIHSFNMVGMVDMESVTVSPGRNDRRPGDKGLSTKSLAYQRDES